VNERSNLISNLQSDFRTRTAYIQAKVSTLVPSQIRALRLKSEMPRQPDLAREAEMQQSRISMLETPGANPTLGTLSAIAAALKVGLVVRFVPFSEMLAWENKFSQDEFRVTAIDEDQAFLNPGFQAPTSITFSTLSAPQISIVDAPELTATEPMPFVGSVRVLINGQPVSQPKRSLWEGEYQDGPVVTAGGASWAAGASPYQA
jgi:transcriptional regulator with XRE-family HTH domain